jgi:hypothetical protein
MYGVEAIIGGTVIGGTGSSPTRPSSFSMLSDSFSSSAKKEKFLIHKNLKKTQIGITSTIHDLVPPKMTLP